MESRRAVAILPEEPRVGPSLPQRLLGAPKSGLGAAGEAAAPASPKREADAADVHVAVLGAAPRETFVSDAALEPLLAAARDRRASYLRAGFPVVSVVVFVLLLCLAWLV